MKRGFDMIPGAGIDTRYCTILNKPFTGGLSCPLHNKTHSFWNRSESRFLICRVRQQRIIFSIIDGPKLAHLLTLTSLSAFSAFSAVQKSNSIPQQNCFSPKTTPPQFPPEKLKTKLQLIAFECPVHGTMDKLANSDKMTDVVVSD